MSAPLLELERTDETPRAGQISVVPLLRRLHFYAGVLIGPFLVVAAVTGMLYAFAPQIDDVLYDDKLWVEPAGTARPVSDQVAAAQAALPEGTVTAVQLFDDPEATTRVVFAAPGLAEEYSKTVYVDPYTAEVKGELTTWAGATPAVTWLDQFHRDLQLGAVGNLYSELAASWLWVLAVVGLVLWLQRRRTAQRRVRAVLLPEKGAKGVRGSRSWHASLGVWALVGALFLSATGLTWSNYAGENFSAVLTALNAKAPALDTALPGSAPAATSEHAQHDGSAGTSGPVDARTFDTVLAAGRGAGLDGPLELTPATAPGTAWSVAQTDQLWPVRQDKAAVDPATGTVTARADFADRPFLAQLSTLGVLAHMGLLFGLANQIALLLLAATILTLIFFGYRMWWQRRPTRADRTAPFGTAPRRGGWQQLPLWFVIPAPLVLIALGIAMPLLGISLVAFLVLDGIIGFVKSRKEVSARTVA
ncbi:PepSY domain-containing protein [Lentzea sp. NBRC 102530]|uniref:PepSY-associated TM helix domain-containing protein n=1 Tax=Lentzea sp. NBRC 102530 TaxID=3032201 RepID=UPI0024A07C6B|nr:PepSY domain-containing protein [Lentzea sp. NBRC 102530]GLY47699.1 membrane protein [Lentzea sp. NBRC 102530]